MTDRELWIQIRRLILSAVAILDKHFCVGKSAKIPIGDNDNIVTS